MPDTFFRQVAVKLTNEEKLLKAQEVAELVAEVGRLEDEKKSVGSDFKARIDERNASMRRLAYQLRSGTELREVECFERLKAHKDKVEIVRTDTLEVVSERPATPEDRQLSLNQLSESGH